MRAQKRRTVAESAEDDPPWKKRCLKEEAVDESEVTEPPREKVSCRSSSASRSGQRGFKLVPEAVKPKQSSANWSDEDNT